MLKWFYNTSTETALEQPAVVRWLRGLGLSDLHGLGHRSVTPYVNGRCVYCYVFFQLGFG
jgi:hypothetical protein